MALFKKILILTIISSITINLSYAQHWSRGWAPAGKKKRSAANIDYSQQFPGKIIDSENENLDDQHTGLRVQSAPVVLLFFIHEQVFSTSGGSFYQWGTFYQRVTFHHWGKF